MRLAVLFIILGIAVICIIGIGHAFTPAAYEEVRHAREMNQLREDQAARWQANQQPILDNVLLISGSLVLLGGAVGLAIAAVGLPSAGVVAARNAAANVAFDRRFAMAQLQADVQKYIAAQQYQHALPPTTYSPSVTYAPAPRFSNHQEALPGPTIDQLGGAIPTFAELITGGKVGSGNPLLFGYDTTGKAIEGSWRDLYSTAIGGITGSGKTWTAAYLLSQSMMHGARALVIDPHAGDSESLSTRLEPLQGRMIAEPASDQRAMLATVQLVQSEYERRLKSRDQREPWILVCDEFSSLMRGELAKPLALLLESIAQEGRKLGIYAMALGQNWKTTRAGGGELRDSFASAFVHRLRPEQAKMLTGLFADDLPRDILELPPGTSYLMSNAGELRKVRVPMCTAADLQSVARLLGNAPESPVAKPECGQLVAVERAAYCPPQPATAPTAEQQRVLSLFLSGMSPAQIVHELHGVKSSQGSKYQRALNGVLDVLRSSMGTQARAVGE